MLRTLPSIALAALLATVALLDAHQPARAWRKLYVINTAGDDVTVVDVATRKVLGRIEIGPHPHGIAAPAVLMT